MANINWTISALRGVHTDTHGYLVTHVTWRATCVEGTVSHTSEGVVRVAKAKYVDGLLIPYTVGEEFVTFSELGEDTVIGWVKRKLDAKVADVEQGLLDAVAAAEKISVPSTLEPLPLEKPWE